MAKNLFSGVRLQLIGALVATIGGIALTACNSCCDPCTGGPRVYQKPCCASGGGYGGGYAAPAPSYSSPAYSAPAGTTAPMPAPAGGGKACGAGKCG